MSQVFYPKIIIVSGFLLQLPLHQGGDYLKKEKKVITWLDSPS